MLKNSIPNQLFAPWVVIIYVEKNFFYPMEGDEQRRYEGFDSLMARHNLLVARLCMLHADGDVERCTELVQDCRIAIWRHLPSLRKNASRLQEKAWVVWQCRSVFSHSARHRRSQGLLSIDPLLADSLPDDSDNSLRESIDELAVLLSPDERRAFLLMADGYTADDLGLELGIKPRSAVSLRHRIIKKLRKHLHTDGKTTERDPS